MKNKYKIIVILSTLSIIGIIFLQVNWILNVINIQKQQYESEMNNALKNIKTGILQRAAVNFGYNPTAVDYDNSTIQNLILDQQLPNIPTEDINNIIERNLLKSNIKLDFEFAIIKNGLFLFNSTGYEHSNVPKSYKYALNSENSFFLVLYIDNSNSYITQKAGVTITLSIIFTIIILYAFVLTNLTLIRLKNVTEITTDFFNNMTHEFKTPIATINLAVDALSNEKVKTQPEKQGLYHSMIKEENKRMLKLVQKILESAKSEGAAFTLNTSKVNIHELLESSINSFALSLAEKNGTINYKFEATNPIIEGDEVHLLNIFNNLIDNAIKYQSPLRNIHLYIHTTNSKNGVLIKIKDNGMGMTKEALKSIFNKFYRVPTGNVHNVKGFGLGLNYVKTVVNSHQGHIKVESVIAKGSNFMIELPFSLTENT